MIIRYLIDGIKYIDDKEKEEKNNLIEIDYTDSSHSQKGKRRNSKGNTTVVRVNTQPNNTDEISKKN